MTVIERFRIASGDVACDFAPALGGSILSLSVDGVDLLRPTGLSPADIRDTACFVMVPYANRIAHGRIIADGKVIAIGVDPDGAPHALHGHGWRRPWTLELMSDDHAVLKLEYESGDWPWPYCASQTFKLLPDGLQLRVEVTNRHAVSAMPIGIGLHPYFKRMSASAIRLNSELRWLTDSTGLAIEPAYEQRFTGRDACLVQDLDGSDHFFSAPDAVVCVNDVVELSGSSVAGAHIYAPASGDFFCVEPVSHIPNSFGRGDYGISDLLEPTATRSFTFSVRSRRPRPASTSGEVR